jgi:hypothetical protein
MYRPVVSVLMCRMCVDRALRLCCCSYVAVQGWVPDERLDAAMEKYDVDKSGKLTEGQTQPVTVALLQ